MPLESQNSNSSVWVKIAIALVPTLIFALVSFGALNARVVSIEKNFDNTTVSALGTKFGDIDAFKVDHENRIRILEKETTTKDVQFEQIANSLQEIKNAINKLQNEKVDKKNNSKVDQ